MIQTFFISEPVAANFGKRPPKTRPTLQARQMADRLVRGLKRKGLRPVPWIGKLDQTGWESLGFAGTWTARRLTQHSTVNRPVRALKQYDIINDRWELRCDVAVEDE